jgi:hypothetical protein
LIVATTVVDPLLVYSAALAMFGAAHPQRKLLFSCTAYES